MLDAESDTKTGESQQVKWGARAVDARARWGDVGTGEFWDHA